MHSRFFAISELFESIFWQIQFISVFFLINFNFKQPLALVYFSGPEIEFTKFWYLFKEVLWHYM